LKSSSIIWKSLLAAVVMLATYHFAYPYIPHRFFAINGQQRGNYFRAQEYMYEVAAQTNVIIGSSMSLELNETTLGPRYFKLTLPGNSILTALEIIRRSGKCPPVLLIETNTVEGNADGEFLGDLFRPWLDFPRRYSRIFREEGRPTNFIVGVIDAIVHKTNTLAGRLFGSSDGGNTPPAGQVDPALQEQVMRIHGEGYERTISPQLLEEHASRLGEYIDRLASQGCICVLYEMPIDSSLVGLPVPTANRLAIQARFPRDKYHWLTFNQDRNYETLDGIHLSRAEADRVTESLVRQVNAITEENTRTASGSRANEPSKGTVTKF
jgi:hypothetical protein